MMVDGDDPTLHSPAAATKSVQVPNRQNTATTPANDAPMAASSQLRRRFPRLTTILSCRHLPLRPLLSAHYVVRRRRNLCIGSRNIRIGAADGR